MLSTRKQKRKTRTSREAEMLSDLKNMDIMIGSNHFEGEDSEFGNTPRRPESLSYDALVDHNTNSFSNSGENKMRRFAGNGRNSREIDSSSEINKRSGEFTQEMNELMSSVSSQIQRAVSRAINEQVLPHIQASPRSRSGQMPQKEWNVPTERPERNMDPKDISTEKLESVRDMSSPKTCLETQMRKVLMTP